MPGKIKVKVLAGRNLPVMDRASDTTDAFVEIKFGNFTHKTDVCRKSLNPHWNSTEWYRFEVDESELQDEPLQLRLMDHDTYSANDAIGKVVISLAPLLAREVNNTKSNGSTPGAVLSGWIPVFDTMHGIRGELNVLVKVELFSDFNKYKTSSCGVQFFHCSTIPPGYKVVAIHGFVEELVVNDDPEYQWIDKIRTPRASNEARQVAFIKLSNQVQRLVGVKAAELGANAVVGYQQEFDLEGEAGVVARAIGTAVSLITPASTSQSLSIPPCTQQQLRKYLDILASDNESITDLNQYFQHHQDELSRLVNILNPKTPALLDETENIEDDEKVERDLTRQSSVRSYTGSLSIYQDDYVSKKSLRHISEDQTDLNKLLKKTEDSDSDSTGTLQKVKKLKTNFFTKRFGSKRSKKGDNKQDDQISIKSNSSDTSRISLNDLRNEFKKLKRLRKPKFKKTIYTNNQDEGIGMASILARSVIHAHTSLACIAETQDSEHSPSSTMRRTSESEPTINVSDDEHITPCMSSIQENKFQDEIKVRVPEIHTSLKDFNVDANKPILKQRKLSGSCPAVNRSDNLLKLPTDASYYGSLSLSGDSSDVYTSSEEDDESSDQNADSEKIIETTSSVVQTVLNNDVNLKLIAQMDRKLSILEGTFPILKESKSHAAIEDDEEKVLQLGMELSKSVPCFSNYENSSNSNDNNIVHGHCINSVEERLDKSNALCDNDNPDDKHNIHFKFHNPFTHKKVCKSLSAPVSPDEVKHGGFMYRSSKRLKRQFSRIYKSISHYSLIPKKRIQPSKTALSQPGSLTDVTSKVHSHETVLGSPFLSYADLMTLDKVGDDLEPKAAHPVDEYSNSKVHMYIGSEPVSRASMSGPPPLTYHKDDSVKPSQKPSLKRTGLIHTAVETILLDKVQSLLVPTSPDPTLSKERQFFDDVNDRLEKVEEEQKQIRPRNNETFNATKSSSSKQDTVSIISTVSEQSSTPVRSFCSVKETIHDENYHINSDVSKSDPDKRSHGSLINTAMKTILMDKVQALIPTSSEPLILEPSHNEPIHGSHSKHEKHHEHSLIHTAMETILMDKMQALIPTSAERLPVPNSSPDDVTSKHQSHDIKKSDGLLNKAMETMLLDKAQICLPPASAPVILESGNIFEESFVSDEPVKKTCLSKKSSRHDSKSSLFQTAMETILMDKVQTLVSSPCVTSIPEKNTENFELKEDPKEALHKSLLITVNSQVPDTISKHDTCTVNDNISVISYNIEDTEANKIDSLVKSSVGTQGDKKEQCFLSSFEHGKTIDTEEVINDVGCEKVKSSFDLKEKKLTRQNSVDDEMPSEPSKMSKENNVNLTDSFRVTHSKPVLQHFHPILSGPPLETIPSLPETSFDLTESLDIDGVVERPCDCQPPCNCQKCDSETNCVSVCDNLHAACDVDRNEREKDKSERERESPRHARHESCGGRDPTLPQPTQNASLNSTSTPMGIQRRSSDSDLSVTPKGSSLNASTGNTGSGGGAILRPSMNSSNLEMLEYPFLTMSEYPAGFVVHLGGTVCARSVKLVDGGGESAVRAAWWAELRTELRAHARALRCNAVVAYTETAAICEDVCVLSALGTAAVINLDCDFGYDFDLPFPTTNGCKEDETEPEQCSVAHIPYSPGAGPYRAELVTCGTCRKARVPAVLLATCAKPSKLQSYAKAVTVTAVAARVRRAQPASEPGARDISDQLPFLEYELHKMLLAKLRMQGANALFSLQTQISVGERCVMALASGTAVRLVSLPPPTPPRIKASESDKDAVEIQRALWDSFTANKAANGYDIGGSADQISNGISTDIEIEEAAPALELCSDKDTCVLELDEAEDVETAKSLAARRTLMQVFSSSLKAAPGAPPQAFAQVWRARLGISSTGGATAAAERHLARAVDGVSYKLRRLQPCALVAPRFHIELPEDEIQLVVSGTAIPLLDPNKPEHSLPEITSYAHNEQIIESEDHHLQHHDPNPQERCRHEHHQHNERLENQRQESQRQENVRQESLRQYEQRHHMRRQYIEDHSQEGSSRNGDRGDDDNSSDDPDDDDDDIFAFDEDQISRTPQPTLPSETAEDKSLILNGQVPTTVSLTSLSYVSGSRAERRICALRLLFVRETTAVRELGGLSGFLHTFTSEVLAIVRAYTAALGGNALTSFYITQLMLQDNAHKNQGQCLLSVGGDVVHVTY